MNDGIKYMIAAGAIAGVSMAGGVLVGWNLKGESTAPKASGPVSVARPAMLPATMPGGIIVTNSIQRFSPANVRLASKGGTNIHLLTSVATNGSKRLLPRSTWQASAPTGAMSFSAFQQVQNVPEVKKAREEAAEAQRRYFEAMKKAAEGRK